MRRFWAGFARVFSSPEPPAENATGKPAERRAQELYFSSYTHDVRSSLNGLLGLSWLLGETKLDAEQRDCVARIKATADTLLRLTNEMRDFLKLEAGKLELHEKEVSPAELARETIAGFETVARTKRIYLRAVGLEGIPARAVGDVERLQQIFANVVGSAIKFARGGGGVELVASVASESATSQRLRFEARYTGIELPLAHRAQLFNGLDPEAVKELGESFGISVGLTICHRLLQRMGGSIGYAAEAGKSANFWFEVPLRKVAAGAGAGAAVAAAPSVAAPAAAIFSRKKAALAKAKSSLRVLVAEDIEENRQVMLGVLQRLGHVAKIVVNGSEALEELRRDASYDLVLMDCHMPVMDGCEATHRIRSELGLALDRLPIVAVTADTAAENRNRCFAVGMNFFLEKPFTRAALKAAIEAVTSEVPTEELKQGA